MKIITSVCSLSAAYTIYINCIPKEIYSTLALNAAKTLIHAFNTLHLDECSHFFGISSSNLKEYAAVHFVTLY